MIRFPWPPRELSPNAREDRRAIAGIRSRYRAAWGWTAKQHGVKARPPASLHIAIVFRPPDRRKRDLDNMLSSIKSGMDGLADVLRVDDSFWTLSLSKGEPVPGGAVDIEIGAPVAVNIELRGTIT